MVAAAILAAVDLTAEAWKRLTPEQKKKIKAQYDKGAKGMAKIMASNAVKFNKAAKNTAKNVSKAFLKNKKGKGKR
jgi:hypothetical protein